MTEDASAALDQLLAELPVTHAPVEGILRAGRTIRRRRRRSSLAGVTAMTALALGGATVGNHLFTSEAPLADSSEHTTPIDLPTGDWKPGEGGSQALISGTVALDENHCVFLDYPGYNDRTYVLWPAGYSATVDQRGQVSLLDTNGTQVARSGDQISMGGGYFAAPAGTHPCLPKSQGEVAIVESEVTVTQRGALPRR